MAGTRMKMPLQFIHLRGEMSAAAMGGNVRLVFEGIRPGDVCERFTWQKAKKYKYLLLVAQLYSTLFIGK